MDRDLKLIIRDRQQVLIDEQVSSVSSYNDNGVFDVLPQHTNFISLIHKFISIRRLSGEIIQIQLDNGIMRVYEEKIDVFLGLR